MPIDVKTEIYYMLYNAQMQKPFFNGCGKEGNSKNNNFFIIFISSASIPCILKNIF